MNLLILLYLVCATSNLWAAYDYYQEGSGGRAALSGTLAALMIYLALRLLTGTWSIEEKDRIFTLRRNGKLRFQGRRMDIVTVTRHSGFYGLKPRKGWTIYIPKKSANETLLKLVGDAA